MAHYTGPKCKLCRREKMKLFLKGDRCFSPKCPIEKKGPVPPGEHGQRRSRQTDYGKQLREKQKAKRVYGVLEKQFKNYFQKASKQKKGAGLKLLQLLEMRLDNILYRSGIASSRSFSRQLIRHGFCLVNGEKVDIPSYHVKIGDVVTLNNKGLKLKQIKEVLEEDQVSPPWMEKKVAAVKIKRLPERDEIETGIQENLIVEFYSR